MKPDPIGALMEREGLSFPDAVERLARNMSYPVHPAAALFPMMSEPELADLAADIKANGLIHPIVLGAWKTEDGEAIEGLIDGRNRLKACELAGVEPSFANLNGVDPLAFIVSCNVERRSLTAGQKAIATALIYPNGGKGGRGKKGNPAESAGFSDRFLRDARAIVRWSRPTALEVLGGAAPFDVALKEARDAERIALINDAQVTRLRNEAPDLAEAVERGELTPLEATAKLDERIEHARQIKESQWRTMIDLTQSGYSSLCGWVSDDFADRVHLALEDPAFVSQMAFLVRLDPKKIEDLIHGLDNLVSVLGALSAKGGGK